LELLPSIREWKSKKISKQQVIARRRENWTVSTFRVSIPLNISPDGTLKSFTPTVPEAKSIIKKES